MRKDLERIIELPEGTTAEIEGSKITLKRNGEPASRDFGPSRIKAEISDGKIRLFVANATRRESEKIGTMHAHIKNMIKGLEKEFTYTLEICNVHFPMNVKVEGQNIVIKSFLGETTKRIAKIVGGAKVEISGNKISVSSRNIEAAGQTAANIEKATKVSNGRERRIFQDGIFITEKPGRSI